MCKPILTDPCKLTLMHHLFVHGCDALRIRERTGFSMIFIQHYLATLPKADYDKHRRNKCHKGPYHFATSRVVTGADAYQDGRY